MQKISTKHGSSSSLIYFNFFRWQWKNRSTGKTINFNNVGLNVSILQAKQCFKKAIHRVEDAKPLLQDSNTLMKDDETHGVPLAPS
jgi:hypothetical protein